MCILYFLKYRSFEIIFLFVCVCVVCGMYTHDCAICMCVCIVCVYVVCGVYMHICVMVCTWKSEDNFWELVSQCSMWVPGLNSGSQAWR